MSHCKSGACESFSNVYSLLACVSIFLGLGTACAPASGLQLTPTSIPSGLSDKQDTIDASVIDLPKVAPVDLDFLETGGVPKSLEQIKAMQARIKSLTERIKDATVSITMRTGQGTGVLVSSDGVILTAAHVIGRPRQMALITFRDGSRARAITLGVEAGKDSGMLKILNTIKKPAGTPKAEDTGESKTDQSNDSTDKAKPVESEATEEPSESKPDESKPENDTAADDENSQDDEAEAEVDYIAKAFENVDLPFFDYLDLGVSNELRDGQWVMAVGHPGGLDSKRGMVVRVGRIINRRDEALRTDCTLVGGDSGGPLVDMQGNVVAIHSRIGSRIQDNIHVPVDVFSDTWDELSRGLKLGERGRLGLSIEPGSNIVSKTIKAGPADKAGINVGDIITAVESEPVVDRGDLAKLLARRVPFEKVNVTVKRGSRQIDLEVMLADAESLKMIQLRQKWKKSGRHKP